MEFPEMTEHQTDTPDAGWNEMFARLGLTGATEITYAEWQKLPSDRRHYLEAARDVAGARPMYLRLADPPPVAALRAIVRELGTLSGENPVPAGRVRIAYDAAAAALAEFDGASS